jgi:hypothetical protein
MKNKSITRNIILSHKSGGGFTLPSKVYFDSFTIPSRVIPIMPRATFINIKPMVSSILGQNMIEGR